MTGLPTGYNFQVDGGSNDENQLLLDGVPVYHPGHINSLLPVFNGDAARWGAKYAYEVYELAEQDDLLRTRYEPVHQFSLFYDNLLRLTPRLTAQVGVHFVGYLPRHHRSYYSIQPRFSLKYHPAEKELFYLHFSRMEQFYHYLRFDYLSLPTDFRMPSIDGFRPRSSEHYEAGWKHFLENGQIELSAYYKTRRHVVALSPETFIEDDQWDQYIMTGNGDSYGAKAYFYNTWKRWTLQLSYAYTRSREWFPQLEDRGKLPSLYDIPHQLGAALSCQIGRHSSLSLGGTVRSGRIIELDEFLDPLPADRFRTEREHTRYRLDAGYSFRKDFGADKLLLLRLGLYNIVGNPSEEEVLSYYSVHWYGNCLPYASVSFKF